MKNPTAKCLVCNRRSDLQLDHIQPRVCGGEDVPWNLQLLCGPCNRLKSGRPYTNAEVGRLRLLKSQRRRRTYQVARARGRAA